MPADDAPEWMQMLSLGDDDRHERSNALDALSTDDWLMDTAAAIPDDVADEKDAAKLLAAVKERLAERGEGAKYQRFLTAVSATPPKYEVAEKILADDVELASSFRKCFGGAAANMRAAALVAAANSKAPAFREDPTADRSGAAARVAQLVQLLLGAAAGSEQQRAQLTQFALRRAEQPRFPRRLVILRGPPGLGKSTYAESRLVQEDNSASVDLALARLTHICSTDDFFMQQAKNSTEREYVFVKRAMAANSVKNEARVRLAMEVGIEPLFVDNANMQLSDMRSYVMLADRMGYVVTIVAPHEISSNWSDVDFLVARNSDKTRKHVRLGKPALTAMIKDFDDLAGVDDPRPAIRAAEASQEDDDQHSKTLLPPTALLYKFESLLKEGTDLLRYTPPDGRGWGVNGELLGEWQSFREKADGSCTYDDGNLQWSTEDPETGWTFTELAMLEELRKQAASLNQAALPSATSHPALFAQRGATAKLPAKRQRAPEADDEESVPAMSRKERLKQRLVSKVKDEEPLAKAQKAGTAGPASATAAYVQVRAGLPTDQEETSAATFLAAVKSRLTEWGKLDQYHEFVCALSGTIDPKGAVRILRGHDDLLLVFRNRFAPRADLQSIKAELQEEEDEASHSPGAAPVRSAVKQELGSKAWGADDTKPHAPAGPPPRRLKEELARPGPVKQELGRSAKVFGKGVVKLEDMPRPPTSAPNAARGPVTIGDDSDDEGLPDEASIAAAVRKGRNGCIASLAKLVFRKEQDARGRLEMVSYATKVAAKPRFPRELFILRGVPGIGKSEFAEQRLNESTAIESGEELAARLTHVCAMSDFFEEFEAHKLEAYHARNEARVNLAMEAGIHPIYVDCPNLMLWEMRPYVLLAERLGYVVTVLDPSEINESATDLNFLVTANDTASRLEAGKVANRGTLKPMLDSFEDMPCDQEPAGTIRKQERSAGEERLVAAKPSPPEPRNGLRAGKKPLPAKSNNAPKPPTGKPPQNAQAHWMKVKTEGGRK